METVERLAKWFAWQVNFTIDATKVTIAFMFLVVGPAMIFGVSWPWLSYVTTVFLWCLVGDVALSVALLVVLRYVARRNGVGLGFALHNREHDCNGGDCDADGR